MFRIQIRQLAAFGLITLAVSAPASASGLVEVTLNTNTASKQESRSSVAGQQTAQVTRGASVSETSQDTGQKKGNGTEINQPLLVTVSLDRQSLSVFKGVDLIKNSRVSSGKKGHSTPTGVFSILGKRRYHRSNIYSGAPMPYMQRLTWSGIALHEGRVPNYPASHGCVRLPRGFARELFSSTPHGTHVVIAHEEVEPGRVNHPSLFQPARETWELASLRLGISDFEQSLGIGVEPKEEVSDAPLRIYLTRTTLREKVRHLQQMLNEAGFESGEADGVYGQLTVSAVKKYQKAHDLRATGTMTNELVQHLIAATGAESPPDGMIYVRQKQKPLFEAPVTFRDPSKPLGTHLFLTTAHSATATGWIGVSLSSRLPRHIIRDNGLDEALRGKRIRMDMDDALDNIVIPDKARRFIEARLTENSSFAISDNGLGTETGKGTDFIVQTH